MDLDTEIDFNNQLIGRQKYTHELLDATYRSDVAPARTFGFLHEGNHGSISPQYYDLTNWISSIYTLFGKPF